jgi:phage-related protein
MNDAKVLVKFNGDTKNLDDASGKAKKSLGGFKGFAKGVGASIAGIFASAAAVATSMLVDITKQSLQARADLEQNLGGVETLFKENADKVVENAKKAYETAGVSANQYMQGVTSFAASLLQSTAGNTEKAADIADMAFTDMADNANKMGTAMESIQNAYQGFAKQNYTMLDNLKLGYGGTKTEMERLLADAEKISGVKYDIKNLSDVYEAIHVIQDNLGITGTTAKEASETITGSMNAAKAAWQNFLSGTIDVKDLVKTIITAAKNIARELLKILPDIAQGLVDLINGLIPFIPPLLQTLLPVLMQGIMTLTKGIVAILPQLTQTLLQLVIQIVQAIAEALPEMIPTIVEGILAIIPILIDNIPLLIEVGIELIIGLLSGIIQCLPTLLQYIPKIVISIVKALVKLPILVGRQGINMMISLAQAIMNNVFKVINSAKNLGKKVINTIKEVLSPGGLVNIGKNLVTGLWNGINNAKDWVLDKIKGFGKSVIKGIKGIFGIKSPSKVMFEIGGYLDKGFINGIDSMKTDIEKAINGTFSLSPNVTNSASANFSPSINVINNIEMKQDPLGQMVNQIKTFQGGAKNDYNYGKA